MYCFYYTSFAEGFKEAQTMLSGPEWCWGEVYRARMYSLVGAMFLICIFVQMFLVLGISA